jgi:PAS domain S-box-containing protein
VKADAFVNEPTQAAASTEVRTPSPSVLVVDDEAGFAATLSDILTTKGYRAVIAESGHAAMEIVQHEPVDLALVDLRLPDMSGVDVLARLRESSPRTEVIILTGNASLETAVRALNSGAFGYLEKPYDIDRLFLLIEHALARRARRDGSSRLSRLAQYIDRSLLPVFAFYPDSGQVLCASAAFTRLVETLGAGSGEVSLADLFRSAPVQLMTDHLARLKLGGSAVTEMLVPTRSGTEVWYEICSARVDGKPETALATIRDVTARHSAERESDRARLYFEAIFDNLAAGVAIIDSQFVIQSANPAFARFYKKTPGALAGRRCHEVIHGYLTPCQRHGEVCPIVNCLAIGTTTRSQHRHLDAEGRVHYQECTIAPLRNEQDVIISFVAMYADFTEIKQAQEDSEAKSRQLELLNAELVTQRGQLEAQAAALEKANAELLRLAAAKDDFVSMVSHELRTPLTAISEGISLVSDGSLGTVSASQSRFLDLAHRNCGRLGDLINDLLDLSKIEAGRLEARPSRVDVARIVAETVETFAAAARERRLAIEVANVPGPMHAYADERMLRRILANLVSNAVKFTDAGSVRLETSLADSEIVIAVADTGIGIPAAEHGRVFEKFHQVHMRERGRPQGTGLGLCLTQQMVEMNRGRIWFESREGVGTTFRFAVPTDCAGARVGSLLAHSNSGTPRPDTARELALVRPAGDADAWRRCGTDVLAAFIEDAEHLIAGGPLASCSRQILPGAHELVVLLEGTDTELAVMRTALHDSLAGAGFGTGANAVRPALAFRRVNGGADPDALLGVLRNDAAKVD